MSGRRHQSYQHGPKQFKKRGANSYKRHNNNNSNNSHPPAQRNQFRRKRPLQHYNRTIRPTIQSNNPLINNRSTPSFNNHYRFQTSRGVSVSNGNLNRSRMRHRLQNETRNHKPRRPTNAARRLRPDGNSPYHRRNRNTRGGGEWNTYNVQVRNQHTNQYHANQQNGNEQYFDQNDVVYDPQRQQNVSSIVSYAAQYGVQTNQTGNVEDEMVNILVPRSVIQNMMGMKQEV